MVPGKLVILLGLPEPESSTGGIPGRLADWASRAALTAAASARLYGHRSRPFLPCQLPHDSQRTSAAGIGVPGESFAWVSTAAHREPLGVTHMEPVWRRGRIPNTMVAFSSLRSVGAA
jgi:hypothetical protein